MDYWVKSLSLTGEDRKCLLAGGWLNDGHIFAGLTLLKKKYSKQNGLMSTQLLAKKLEWKSSNVDFIQVVHISGNHWVCASNKHSSPGVCDVYDSMPASLSPTLSRQLAVMMKYHKPSFTVRFISVQMQSGASDCGLFALAFAVALCSGKDPHKCSFQQDQMRHHLATCFENGELTEFQAEDKPQHFRSSVKFTRQVQCTVHAAYHGTGQPVSMETLHNVENVGNGFTRNV